MHDASSPRVSSRFSLTCEIQTRPPAALFAVPVNLFLLVAFHFPVATRPVIHFPHISFPSSMRNGANAQGGGVKRRTGERKIECSRYCESKRVRRYLIFLAGDSGNSVCRLYLLHVSVSHFSSLRAKRFRSSRRLKSSLRFCRPSLLVFLLIVGIFCWSDLTGFVRRFEIMMKGFDLSVILDTLKYKRRG